MCVGDIGRVSDAVVATKALNEKTAKELWEASEKYVGLQWQP